MPEYIITAIKDEETKYYCAFDLMVKPNVLQTTPHLDSAFEFKSLEKAEGWKDWLEKKFPEFSYKIEPK
ncbi:hypothetical protein AHMF7605_11745 [Adhaeribacter arboris]|uniref:Uncharacterized protein n=1 Tax=Adhaeribacter arboris TaxID=2072846 RepID=A0A2T2YF66_9BACT|nr:hypothetical protein [Adhaeribacter arboris]PSR54144.1 hypothetical protein AHMF7605_11745 [Adhaeribacter arboris]